MKLRLPLPKEQEALKRKAGSIKTRLLEDTKRKTKQAKRMLGNAASLSSTAKKKSKEAEAISRDNTKVRFRAAAAFLGLVPKMPHCRTAVGPGIQIRDDLTNSSRKRSHGDPVRSRRF